MSLRWTLIIATALFAGGSPLSYVFMGFEWALWYAVGSGMALMNVLFAAGTIRYGLANIRRKGIFLGALLIKSTTFLALITVVLLFLKPKVLPFTLGLSVVIFASIVAALIESRRYLNFYGRGSESI